MTVFSFKYLHKINNFFHDCKILKLPHTIYLSTLAYTSTTMHLPGFCIYQASIFPFVCFCWYIFKFAGSTVTSYIWGLKFMIDCIQVLWQLVQYTWWGELGVWPSYKLAECIHDNQNCNLFAPWKFIIMTILIQKFWEICKIMRMQEVFLLLQNWVLLDV